MRNSFVIIALLLSFFSQTAAPASCNGELTTQPGLQLNLEIYFDSRGQPQLRLVPGPQPAPPPQSAPPRQVERQPAVPQPSQRFSLSAHFKNLMNHGALIYQNDYRLANRGLLVPNGGLCGSTCGVNVVHAMLSYLEGSPRTLQADYFIHRIVENTLQRFGHDARTGITLHQLASGLDLIAQELGIRIQTEHISSTTSFSLTPDLLVPRENELLIASIQSGVAGGGKKFYHAIVITDANVSTREIAYSDPQHPNHWMRTMMQSHYDENGNVSVKIAYQPPANSADGYTGVVSDLLRVRILRP